MGINFKYKIKMKFTNAIFLFAAVSATIEVDINNEAIEKTAE